MSEKRPASDDPSDGQLVVKRQNVGTSRALTRPGASASSGALVQAVCPPPPSPRLVLPRASRPVLLRRRVTDCLRTDAPDQRPEGSADGALGAHGRDLRRQVRPDGEPDSVWVDGQNHKCAPHVRPVWWWGRHVAADEGDAVLWRTYGDCENYGVLNGHRAAILDLQWSRDSDILFSASADTHLASWDLTSGTRIRRYVGHEEIVNSIDISRRGEELLVSGSDDGTIGIWDPRTKHAADYIETDFPITAVAVSEAGNEIYSGGIDNDIKVWDIRKKALVHSMLGHHDTITTLRVSPDGQQLLSYAMDSTARTWDIRPFAPAERHIRTFDGAPLGLEKNLIRGSWDSDGRKIAVGAGDGTVVIWGSDSGKLLYKLPGHKGTVNCAEFAPGGAPISWCPQFQ